MTHIETKEMAKSVLQKSDKWIPSVSNVYSIKNTNPSSTPLGSNLINNIISINLKSLRDY